MPASRGLRDILNVVTLGAIDRKEERADKRREAQKDIDLAKESLAKSWSDTERNASMAARSAELEVESGADQARAGAISQFQAESSAMDAAGRSGIAEGSPYMALQSSINEADRNLRNMFTQFSESIAMGGEGTAISVENARFNQKQGLHDIGKAQKSLNDASENAGLVDAMDIFGSFFSAVNFVSGIGKSLASAAKLSGKNISWMTKSGSGLLFDIGIGAELDYSKITGDNSFFENYMPKEMDTGGFGEFFAKIKRDISATSGAADRFAPPENGMFTLPVAAPEMMNGEAWISPLALPALKKESSYSRRFGNNGFFVPTGSGYYLGGGH